MVSGQVSCRPVDWASGAGRRLLPFTGIPGSPGRLQNFSRELPPRAEFGRGHRAHPRVDWKHAMRHIPTTRTAVERLKHEAKQLRNPRVSLLAAREQAAKNAGYDSWKHVSVCFTATQASKNIRLPDGVERFLAAERESTPLSSEGAEALTHGVVFAMDVKDATNARFEEDVLEFDAALPHLAADVLRSYLAEEREVLELHDDDVLQYSIEHLSNYRFFRYTGRRSGTTLNDAFADVLGRHFFAPEFVWVDGKCHDMSTVKNVTVDGEVLYSSGRNADGLTFATYRPLRGTGPASPGTAPVGVQRRHAEKLLKEIFEIEDLAGLLDGSAIAIYNSDSGGVFGRLADGSTFSVNDRLDGYVASRLTELLRALGEVPAVQEADVEVNDTPFCLTLLVPPVVSRTAWTILARGEVSDEARRPIAARISL